MTDLEQAEQAPPGEAAALEEPASSRVVGGQLQAPDATFVHSRWIPRTTVEWVERADRIMMEYGLVLGSVVLDRRHRARWRAQRLIRLMVELRLHERWELAEHVERKHGGFIWSVEYRGGSNAKT